MSKWLASAATVRRLEDLPNVGAKVATLLRRLGIDTPAALRGRDPYALYDALNAASGEVHDPCVLDTFIALTRFMAGEAARPWWAYTAERKAHLAELSSVPNSAPNSVRNSA